MKIFAEFNEESINFNDAFLTQYKRYLKNKPIPFKAWINLPGSQRTKLEHNSLCGNIGLVAKQLNASPEWVYWRTRTDPDCCQDAFEVEEYDQITGEFLGTRTRGLSELDHEDMVNYKVNERFMNYWQQEIDAYESDKSGHPTKKIMKWYIKENLL